MSQSTPATSQSCEATTADSEGERAQEELTLALEVQLKRAKREIDDLREELTQMKATKQNSLFMRLRQSLPPEILRKIFTLAIPPPFLLDSSLQPGPNSPWCHKLRTEKSIVSVCRSWWQVGVEFLYEDVVLRRIGQVPALARTLDDTERNLGRLVKGIRVHCFIPGPYVYVFETCFRRIFERCPGITKLTHGTIMNDVLKNTSDEPLTERILSAAITDFECQEYILYSRLVQQLPLFTNLVSLSFFPPKSEENHPSPVVRLERLEYLRLTLSWVYGDGPDMSMANFIMPRLHSLTFIMGQSRNIPTDSILQCCKGHGGPLRYLCIDTCAFDPHSVTHIQELMDLCPLLEHIALYFEATMSFFHPRIKYVDLWCRRRDNIVMPYWPIFPKNYLQLPALQEIRLLDTALVTIRESPLPFPPDAVEREDFDYIYPGIHVKQTACGVEVLGPWNLSQLPVGPKISRLYQADLEGLWDFVNFEGRAESSERTDCCCDCNYGWCGCNDSSFIASDDDGVDDTSNISSDSVSSTSCENDHYLDTSEDEMSEEPDEETALAIYSRTLDP